MAEVNCREAQEMLAAYRDGEIGAAAKLDLESHLRTCPACTAELRRLVALKAVRTLPARRAGRWPMVLLTAAVCIAAFVAVGTSSHSTLPQTDLVKELVSAHIRSLQANHLLDMSSTDLRTVEPWFTGRLDFAPHVTPPRGLDLIGGRLDYLDGRAVAAFVFRREEHTVNLFTWPANQPDQTPASETLQGFRAVHRVRAGMHYWAVSDVSISW